MYRKGLSKETKLVALIRLRKLKSKDPSFTNNNEDFLKKARKVCLKGLPNVKSLTVIR